MLFNTPFTKIFTTLIFINTCAFTQLTLAKDEWKLTLKNAYIDRNLTKKMSKIRGVGHKAYHYFITHNFMTHPLKF